MEVRGSAVNFNVAHRPRPHPTPTPNLTLTNHFCLFCFVLFCFVLFFCFFRTLLLFSFWTTAVVTGVVPSPPRFLPSNFIAHRVPAILLLVDCSSSVAANSRSRAFRKSICAQEKKVPTNLYERGFELTKLTYTRLEDNLIRHRGDHNPDPTKPNPDPYHNTLGSKPRGAVAWPRHVIQSRFHEKRGGASGHPRPIRQCSCTRKNHKPVGQQDVARWCSTRKLTGLYCPQGLSRALQGFFLQDTIAG